MEVKEEEDEFEKDLEKELAKGGMIPPRKRHRGKSRPDLSPLFECLHGFGPVNDR